MVSFAGFPLGGLAAFLLTGPVDSTASAIAGGLVTGVVLGAVQAWAMRADRRLFAAWALATAVGLAVGLAIGASLVGFSTGLGDLAIQGAFSGPASASRRPSFWGPASGWSCLPGRSTWPGPGPSVGSSAPRSVSRSATSSPSSALPAR